MKFPERVRVATTGVSTGPLTMAATAVSPEFRTVVAAGLVVGDTFPYSVGLAGSAEWECGIATITTISNGTATFSRTPTSSSNGNALVNFSAGTKEVIATPLGATLAKWENGTSVRVVFTSSACFDDGVTSLAMSPVTGPSQTAALQKLFDKNNDGSTLRIVWDSKYSLDSASSTYCLLVNSNTDVIAMPGCGAVMRKDQPTSMFRNRNPNVVKDGSGVNTSNGDRNISFRGGIWHGNQDNQSVRETAATGGIFLFDFLGVDSLNMTDGIEWRRPVSFAFRGTNVSNVLLQNFFVNFGMDNTKLNSDGIHFNGPAQHLRLLDGRIYGCADDSLSFTANDIFNAPGNYGPYGGVYGPILDVTIDNMEIHSIAAGIRLLSSTSRMDRFSINNIKGDFGGNWLVIDNFTADPNLSMPVGPGNIGTIRIGNIHVLNRVNGDWPKKGAYLNCQIERLLFHGISREYFENEFFPAVWCGPRFKATQVLIENYHSTNTSTGTYMKDQIFFDNGCQIQQLKIKGAMFHSNSAVNGCPIAVEVGANIKQMVLDDCQGIGFTDFVRKDGTVGSYHVGANCYMDNAVPSTWTLQSGAPWVEDTSLPNRLLYSGRSPNLIGGAKKNALDAFGGNVELSADITISGTLGSNDVIHAALLVRGNSIVPWSGAQAAYGLDISVPFENQIKIFKQVGSTQTVLGSPVAMSIPMGAGFRYYLAAKTSGSVTTVTAKVKRLSDGLWLQPGGTWSAAAANAISVTDSSIPAQAGEWGFYGYNEFTTNGVIAFDNISTAAAT